MYRDLSALLAAKELDLQVADAKVAELRAEVETLTARVETLEKELADVSRPTNRDAVLEAAVKRSEDLARENRHRADQLGAARYVLGQQSRRIPASHAASESIARTLAQIGESVGRLFKR